MYCRQLSLAVNRMISNSSTEQISEHLIFTQLGTSGHSFLMCGGCFSKLYLLLDSLRMSEGGEVALGWSPSPGICMRPCMRGPQRILSAGLEANEDRTRCSSRAPLRKALPWHLGSCRLGYVLQPRWRTRSLWLWTIDNKRWLVLYRYSCNACFWTVR